MDLSQYEKEDSVVQVRIEKLKTVANRLSVNVLVYSQGFAVSTKKFGVLTTDAAVRLYPDDDLGDLQYPKGKAPAQVATTIVAHGDPGNWPFDTYTTDVISADVFTGGLPERGMGPHRSDRIVGRLGRERHSRPRRRRHREPGQPRQRDHHVAQVQGRR